MTATALVLGSGGREAAFVQLLKKSMSLDRVLCAPGNAGMDPSVQVELSSLTDRDGLRRIVEENSVNLVVIGPEVPLAADAATFLREECKVLVVGPGSDGARLESSKAWASQFQAKHDVPQPAFEVFDDAEKAIAYLAATRPPWVIKADGLAAGKGVVVTGDRDEAEKTLRSMMIEKVFGSAGETVVIQECLTGWELSVFAFVSGRNFVHLGAACDYKRLLDDDKGPNTGGMGAYSPVPKLTEGLIIRIYEEIMRPTVHGLADSGIDYRGFLYAGLMITAFGPKVLEFNVRMGDPEAQVVLPLVVDDFGKLCLQVASGSLKSRKPVRILDQASLVCVTLASRGYPENPESGFVIDRLKAAASMENVMIFPAGVKREGKNLVTAGGRVLYAVGIGNSLSQARPRAYAAAEMIEFEGKIFRNDIAKLR